LLDILLVFPWLAVEDGEKMVRLHCYFLRTCHISECAYGIYL
jgi:hypothetical protein